jgi:16S rRNA (cytosine1402-N4)-methyltransferase
MSHVTVLLDEAVAGLALSPTSVVVDVTLGSAGHARAICEQLGPRGHYIGIDADQTAVSNAQVVLQNVRPQTTVLHGNFAQLDQVLNEGGIQRGSVHAILADLGWRTEQFEAGGKGFSFRYDEPLQMTFGNPADYPFTASDIVNEWTVEQITTIIGAYGEERYARRIARAIVAARANGPIVTTRDLVAIIEGAVPVSYRHGRLHCATRTFQALRMTVNDELAALEALIEHALGYLRVGGRLAIITFHSLEDRVVKHRFRELALTGRATLLTKRPIVPQPSEIAHNPRARSAKLRIISITNI